MLCADCLRIRGIVIDHGLWCATAVLTQLEAAAAHQLGDDLLNALELAEEYDEYIDPQ
jgi:hypothetical protein